MVDEWSCFFDTLIKVFDNCTKTIFSNISSLLQYIGFAVTNYQIINFAQLICQTTVRRITAAKRDHGLGNKVQCYYPKFLSIILNHLLSPEHIAPFNNSVFEVSQTTNKKFYTRLGTSLKYTNILCCCDSLLVQLYTSTCHTRSTSSPRSLNLQWINPHKQECLLPFRYYLLSLVLMKLNPKWMLGLTMGL